MKKWRIYKSTTPNRPIPLPPPWRRFEGQPKIDRKLRDDPHAKRRFGDAERGRVFQANEKTIDLVNAAIYLRRPLLVTGKPGVGKSSLAYSIAHDLDLGPVLRWPITSRSTLKDGLYSYDAIGRLQEAQLNRPPSDPNISHSPPDIGKFIQLGPLGTALLPTDRPRVLLIDEIDKSDIDLPNDLLNIFEEGEYDIPELSRLPPVTTDAQPTPVYVRPHDVNPKLESDTVPIYRGRVLCHAFPIILLTSNGERELPPAFLRRCLRLTIEPPDKDQLADIVTAHFKELTSAQQQEQARLIKTFVERRDQSRDMLATDQLLNAIYLLQHSFNLNDPPDKESLIEAIFKSLTSS